MKAVEPRDFPWYDYRGFTFSLGLQVGGHVFNSGHSGSVFDPEKGKPDVRGGMADQARVAYAKQAAVLDAVGLSLADVTHVVENVTVAGLSGYPWAQQVRRELFGANEPTVTTVVVDRLVRAKALIEVEVQAASPPEWPAGHDGTVYLPALLPLDAAGDVVAPGDAATQYTYCLDRAAELLDAHGLSLTTLVSVVDHVVPEAIRDYPAMTAARQALMGRVRPATASVVMSRLHRPGMLVAVKALASSRTVRPLGNHPGDAAVRAGHTLHLTGSAFVGTAARASGDLRRQAEACYHGIVDAMAAAGARPRDLLSTVEYVAAPALPAYREVADVRRGLLREPYPVSTGLVCAGFPQPGLVFETVAVALVPGGPDDAAD